mgnify:CR=1 FL=1
MFEREQIDERAWRLRCGSAWGEVAAGLVHDAAIRDALTEGILATPFAAVFWEALPVAPTERAVAFECMVLAAPGLAQIEADGTAFAGPLAGARAPEVRAFANLSGDAELVVPAPGEAPYPHLAAFLRAAPTEQVHALWREVGRAVERWLTTRGTRVWVSTAGLGVPWLHVRLDGRPKYVKWAAYRAMR